MLNVCYVFIEFKKISSYNSIHIELLAGGGDVLQSQQFSNLFFINPSNS